MVIILPLTQQQVQKSNKNYIFQQISHFRNVGFGASVQIEGTLKESEAAKQKFELEVSSIHVVGGCDNTVSTVQYVLLLHLLFSIKWFYYAK